MFDYFFYSRVKKLNVIDSNLILSDFTSMLNFIVLCVFCNISFSLDLYETTVHCRYSTVFSVDEFFNKCVYR